MKNKFKFLTRFFIVYTWLLLASCNSDIDEKQNVKIPRDAYTVTSEEAKFSAINIDAVSSLAKTPREKREIVDFVAVPNSENPSYYILNYKSGGFTIIAGDKRIEPVLAYSEEGYFPKSGALPSGLIDWLALNDENAQKLKLTSYEVPAEVAHLWSQLLTGKKMNGTSGVAKLPPPGDGGGGTCTDVNNYVDKGPYLVTRWGQNCGYNDFTPAGTRADMCWHMPTGCVATSMAQAMNFWRRPVSYNWAAMPANTGSADIAHLMADAGSNVSMQYTNDGSGAYMRDVPSALKNNFGYTYASYGGFNYETAKNNLINNVSPVILLGGFTDHYETGFWFWTKDHPSGDGHAWVADGISYNSYFYCDCSCGGENYLMHMNWGWDGLANGWFSQSSWRVTVNGTTFNFKYFRDMVYNIHP